jgi:hypothetical protein
LNQTAFSFFTAAFSQQLFHSSFFTAHSRTKRTLNRTSFKRVNKWIYKITRVFFEVQ